MLNTIFRHKVLWILCLLIAGLQIPQSEAKWLEATGQARIMHQDLVSARRTAIRDAIQQLSLRAGADVSSFQQMTDGAITADNLRVSSNGTVQDINILDEVVQGNVLTLTIEADVLVDAQSCGHESSNAYLRSAAVASFYLEDPQSASFGGFYDISQKLPADLSQRLNNFEHVKALNASGFQVYTSPKTIPTSVTTTGTLTTAITASNQLGVQYVISGVIRDISMARPDLLRTKSYFSQVKDKMEHGDNRFERRFQMDIYVHDGFSGAMVYTRRYETLGNWNVPLEEKPGFGSVAFWKSDYGQKVSDVFDRVVDDLNSSLSCQPFMAKVTRTEGKKIYIDAGAGDGLRPGDTLNLYRLSTFYDANQNAYTELENTKIVVTLKKVQPFFSRGVVSTETDKLGIQQGDIVIAW